ncbi:MAG: amino acid ABC transporter substrate-binding protein [Rhodospirillales bacterium]|jgi:glutamate/aspartate transport system substrate-binding protein|nr:amino acid ABC transporter substrate-binding protein [Rhodospirillales bacterium]
MRKTLAMIAGLLGAILLTAPVLAADLYGTLAKVQETGVLRIGFRDASAPFSFIGKDGRPAGYSVDLCRQVAVSVKRELKLVDMSIQLVPVTSENRIAKVISGEVDIECGSTSHTLDRREEVDFSYFTFLTGTRLLVKRTSTIRNYKDLAKKTVAVTKGTTNESRIVAMAKVLKIDTTILTVGNHDEGFAAVKDGKADAYATDDILLRGLMLVSGEPEKYAVTGNYLSYDPYALMMRRDDSAFRLLVDRTLADLFFRKEFDNLFDKWFKPMGVPMNDVLKAAMTIQMHVN